MNRSHSGEEERFQLEKDAKDRYSNAFMVRMNFDILYLKKRIVQGKGKQHGDIDD